MPRPDASRIMNGTYGSLWVENELWAEADSFEAKVTINYEDVNFAGEGATFRKATGWNGEGKIAIKKIYSRTQSLMAEKIRAGIYPRIKIVGKLSDPSAAGTERVALYDVTFGEFLLLKFEQKTLGSEEIPFAFSDYEILQSVAPQ